MTGKLAAKPSFELLNERLVVNIFFLFFSFCIFKSIDSCRLPELVSQFICSILNVVCHCFLPRANRQWLAQNHPANDWLSYLIINSLHFQEWHIDYRGNAFWGNKHNWLWQPSTSLVICQPVQKTEITESMTWKESKFFQCWELNRKWGTSLFCSLVNGCFVIVTSLS